MKGEYISVETLKILQDMEKENKELQNKIEKAKEYIGKVCESKNDVNPYTLHAPTLLNILEGNNE